MKIQKITYIRNIESEGKLLVFFKIQNRKKFLGPNNHYMCKNNENKTSREAKTPLDLAICSQSSEIEYISFFIEDEKLCKDEIKNRVIYTNDSILITDERFTFDKRYIDIKMEFNQYIQNRDVFVVAKDAKIDLIGYRLDDDNYVLFDKEDNFSGVVFKNLTDSQMKELEKSNVL